MPYLLWMFFLATTTDVAADVPAGLPFDIQIAKQIIGGGTTPEYNAYPGVRGLASLGTRRLRLINIDDNLKAVSVDGELKIEWSAHLKEGLELCRLNGWVPHLVVGQVLPAPLEITGPEGRKHGPASWPLYDKYVNALLVYVTEEWGFKESEWEVGNEMNVPASNWVAGKLPTDLLDMEGFSAYMVLYTHIAKTVDKFRVVHSQKVMRVGGPAVPGPGYFEKMESRNWTLRFVDEIATRRLPGDFVSAHIYGNDSTGAETFAALKRLRKHIALRKPEMTISISEWGTSWHSDAAVNLGPISGAFVLEFIQMMEQAKVTDAIFLALSEFPDQKWPVLYAMDRTPTHAMKAMQMVSSLAGSSLQCDTGLPSVSCLAVRSPNNDVNVLVWNLDWWNDRIDPAKSSLPNARVAVNISGLESTRYAGSAALMNTHSSNENCPCPLGEVVALGSAVVQLASVDLGYGDFAFLSVSAAK